MSSGFHYAIIVAKKIHDNDIIGISIEYLLSVLFVYCAFCLFFGNELHSKYKFKKVERESVKSL